MPCERIPMPGGGHAHVCGELKDEPGPPCVGCGAASTRLCDGPAPADTGRPTCDAAVCDGCARELARLPAIPSDAMVRIAARIARHGSRFRYDKPARDERVAFFREFETVDLCPACAARADEMPATSGEEV